MDIKNKEQEILTYIQVNPSLSSKEIYEGVQLEISYATVKRTLSKLKNKGFIETEGKGKGTKYKISQSYNLFKLVNVKDYFLVEIDDRKIKEQFNLNLISQVLTKVKVFTESELDTLNSLQKEYRNNIKDLSKSQYNKELERLTIDLSWKSSQIEGNTYSLLETERLLKEKETAEGKSKDDATMLLNHKDAIDFIIENPNYINPLSVSQIEDIHSILIKDLRVERNIRTRRVGISGTNYKPLDNEFQIKEALEQMCELVNKKESVFEKAFLLLLLISYIQAFNDGNKRTARILGNAILISNNYCPISFRTINSVEYKKALLIFYEQNNLMAFKEIFMNQFEFAVKTYF